MWYSDRVVKMTQSLLFDSSLDLCAFQAGSPKCGTCGLWEQCCSPKMPVTGNGRKGILVIAEAPGKEEDKKNIQLIGNSGQLLRRSLELCDVDLDEDCWKTNAIACYSPGKEAKESHMVCCRPLVNQTIRDLQPKVIVLLGKMAVKSVLGQEWTRGINAMDRWVGWQIPLQRLNAWVCPIWHPNVLLHNQHAVLGLLFDRYLESAVSLQERPWQHPPQWESQIIVETSCWDVTLEKLERAKNEYKGKAVAFDYETDRLKPDSSDAKILSCAICFGGQRTIAYPWIPELAEWTSQFLRSDTPKIGANIKFEERWTQKVLGHGVKNWVWDTVQAAHILDNRDGITSVKFQAFVRLGLSMWDLAVENYIAGEDSNSPNRLASVSKRQLLQYNGMDALVEYKLAMLQRKELNETHNKGCL
ncbi:MAG: hypothetical protein GF411_03275 [Candidatus Lokiarchaeota archaeon]|nr:hypothetical protein [Candidatus Lokiarchaeota archaeon]